MSSSYIIRIHRHEANDPSKLAGTVEVVGADGRRGFTCFEQLWTILNQGTTENSDRKNKPKRTTEDK